MRRQGKNVTIFYATARHSGKPHPFDTELVGREKTAEAAEIWQREFGGHVVKVTETVEWSPVSCPSWKRRNGRHYYGPHWITSRKAYHKSGAILALLDHGLKWRGAWMDKCDVMHWEWFPTKSAAMEWVESMAKSKNAATV